MFSRDNPWPESRSAFDSGGETAGCGTVRSWQPTPLSRVFFSRVNIDALQEGIRYRVYVETQGRHVIDRQSDQELFTVMRSIYLQYARNDPRNIIGQVRQLNALVLDYCVRTVVSELGMYMRYLHDISHMPVPMDRGQLATTKGDKQLEVWRFDRGPFGPVPPPSDA